MDVAGVCIYTSAYLIGIGGWHSNIHQSSRCTKLWHTGEVCFLRCTACREMNTLLCCACTTALESSYAFCAMQCAVQRYALNSDQADQVDVYVAVL